MLTGPIHRNPNATRPNAKIEPVSPMMLCRSNWLTKYATAIRPAISMPFQNALKLPATMPERIVSDAPPSRDAVTTSATCFECELVNTLVNSGISTAANVPQLMIVASCHHSRGSAVPAISRSRISSQLMPNDVVMHRMEAIQIRRVSGASKLKSFTPRYFASLIPWLMKYDTPLMKSMRKRIAKIQTMSLAWMSTLATASVMNAISATPVTPYVSNPSAVGPTLSPALSPVQSAMTP